MAREWSGLKTLARQRDKEELLARVRTLRPDSVRRWGRMSVHQMVCHVNDCFRLVLGQKRASPATTLLSRTIVKWVALYLPLAWPPGIPTRPELDQTQGGTSPVDFPADVADLETLLGLFALQGVSLERPPHPTFGRMSGAAWLRWGYLHTDHHLRQFGV